MKVDTERIPVVAVPAELSELNIECFYDTLRNQLKNSPGIIKLDCSYLIKVASSHINILWQAYQICLSAETRLSLKSPPLELVRVIEVLDLRDFFFQEDWLDQIDINKTVAGVTSNTFVYEIKPDSEYLAKTTDMFLSFLTCKSIPALVCFELRTVFYEVVNNILSYGNIVKEEKIHFSAGIDDNKIILTFIDKGEPFDPTKHELNKDIVGVAKQGKKRGFGIAIIRKLTDSMKYERCHNDSNVLILQKIWDQERGV